MSQCVLVSKYSGLNNVGAGEYISLYPLATHSSIKCWNIIWIDILWHVDYKSCPCWHNIEDKLLGSISCLSYTHMSTVMEFAINIFGFLPTYPLKYCHMKKWKVKFEFSFSTQSIIDFSKMVLSLDSMFPSASISFPIKPQNQEQTECSYINSVDGGHVPTAVNFPSSFP